MRKFTLSIALALGSATMLAMPAAAHNPMVGGAAMYPTRNIVQNAVNSKDHTTLVAAVKAAGLVDTLSGPGPFTVFAPTNAAFAKLPAGTVDTLVKPENKATLTKILTYHVVPGRYTASQIASLGGAQSRHRDAQDGRGREPAFHEERQRLGGCRCQGRQGADHHPQRHAVERRDPRRRRRPHALILDASGNPLLAGRRPAECRGSAGARTPPPPHSAGLLFSRERGLRHEAGDGPGRQHRDAAANGASRELAELLSRGRGTRRGAR